MIDIFYKKSDFLGIPKNGKRNKKSDDQLKSPIVPFEPGSSSGRSPLARRF
jgi:hypothetical protein